MSSEMNNLNLKVVILDTDFYAMQAINSYLAWDRRTRVTYMSDSLDDLWDYLGRTTEAELPDVVGMDVGHLDPPALAETITRLCQIVPELRVRTMAGPADNASRCPLNPQEHTGPFANTTACPNSAASP